MGAIKIRKLASGKKVFDAEVKKRGFPRTARTFERLGDARAWIQDVESSMRCRRFVNDAELIRHTLSEAIDRYIQDELPKLAKNSCHRAYYLRWFKKQIGCRLLADVTPALLSECKSVFFREISYRRKHREPQTWNRYASSLSCVFRMCCGEWQWMAENPMRRLKKEKEPAGRVRFLSDDERERLVEACQKSGSRNLYTAVVLCISTGMRRGEVRWLTWDAVDLKNGVIILQQTKNGERRRVPVKDLALELLREHAKVRRLDSNLVFAGESRKKKVVPFEPRGPFARALEQAGIENFRYHDLRHTTASYLAMNGASLLEIAEVLGHKTLQMVKRYSHLADSHTASVVENMNRKIFRR